MKTRSISFGLVVCLSVACAGGCASSTKNSSALDEAGVASPNYGDSGPTGSVSDSSAGAGGGTGEGGGAGEAGSSGGPVVCSSLGSDAWASYAHDAQRTSASGGCITGPLASTWRYAIPGEVATLRAGQCGNPTVLRGYNAIADATGAFVNFQESCSPSGGSGFLTHIDTAMTKKWASQNHDGSIGYWPTLAFGKVALVEDGVFYRDPATGVVLSDGGSWDEWGDTLFDGSKLYFANTFQADGPGIFLAAMDIQGCGSQCGTCDGGCNCPYPATCPKALWTQNAAFKCKNAEADALAALAFDQGTLFQAGRYGHLPGVQAPADGLYARSISGNGAQKWFVPTSQINSKISAGGGNVFLVEGSTLVARSETDGTVSWPPVSLNQPGGQAPALAAGLVVVSDADGIAAFKAQTGQVAWHTTLSGAASVLGVRIGGVPTCLQGASLPTAAGFDNTGAAGVATTIAIATGSGTVIVAAQSGIHVLRLADGTEVWSGVPKGASGRVRNPIVVGKRLYAVDDSGLIAMDSP